MGWVRQGETRVPSTSPIDRSLCISYRKSLSITRLNRRGHPPLSHGSSQKGRRRRGEKGRREREGKRAGFIGVETAFRAIEHGGGRVVIPNRLICISKGVHVCPQFIRVYLSYRSFSLPSAGATVTRDIKRKQSAFDTFPAFEIKRV